MGDLRWLLWSHGFPKGIREVKAVLARRQLPAALQGVMHDMKTETSDREQASVRIRGQLLSHLRTVRSIDVFSLYCAVGDSVEGSSCLAVATELSALIREGKVRLEMRTHALKNGKGTLIAVATLNAEQER